MPRIVDEYKKEFGHEPLEDFPEWEPVHTILLSNNVMGIENLGGDIEKVKGQRFTFCAFPLRWYMGDGAMSRCVALIDEDEIDKSVADRTYKYGGTGYADESGHGGSGLEYMQKLFNRNK